MQPTCKLYKVCFDTFYKNKLIEEIIHIFKNFFFNSNYVSHTIKKLKLVLRKLFIINSKDVGITLPYNLNICKDEDCFTMAIIFGNETYPFLYTSHVGLLQIKNREIYVSKLIELKKTFKNANTCKENIIFKKEADKVKQETRILHNRNYMHCSIEIPHVHRQNAFHKT
tara:strand:+ start:304 stop:810 length:507 start_codon:yes stop_codon:yes gene_type:complete